MTELAFVVVALLLVAVMSYTHPSNAHHDRETRHQRRMRCVAWMAYYALLGDARRYVTWERLERHYRR